MLLCTEKHPFIVHVSAIGDSLISSSPSCVARVQFYTPTQIGDSAGDEAEFDLTWTMMPSSSDLGDKNTTNSGAMDPNLKNTSDIDPDNIIAVTIEDLHEDDRRELEREIDEQVKLRLARFQKTRNGVIKKPAMPSKPLGTEVKNSIEDIAHLVDTSVASKYGSDLAEMSRKFDKLQGQLEESISRHVRSAVLQINDENLGKKPMPDESSKLPSFADHTHTPGASVSAAQNLQVPLDNKQGGLNYANSSANNFMPSTAPPTVSTSVAQYHNNNSRSGTLNPNLQQPYYQTVAYNSQPSCTQLGTNSQPGCTQLGTSLQPSCTQLGTNTHPNRITLNSVQTHHRVTTNSVMLAHLFHK